MLLTSNNFTSYKFTFLISFLCLWLTALEVRWDQLTKTTFHLFSFLSNYESNCHCLFSFFVVFLISFSCLRFTAIVRWDQIKKIPCHPFTLLECGFCFLLFSAISILLASCRISIFSLRMLLNSTDSCLCATFLLSAKTLHFQCCPSHCNKTILIDGTLP